ncbi:MAG: electron transport complex subunit RsxG [Gammaproteobacteria bacterium]
MIPRSGFIAAGLLAAFAAVGAGLVAITQIGTADRIAQNERLRLMRTIDQTLPRERYDNDLLADTVTLTDPELLGRGQETTVYRAFKDDKPAGAVFTTRAPDGYNGEIRLLMAVNHDGTLSGVRVLKHKETPGLGDLIDIQRSDWLHGFDGKSLDNPEPEDWKVRKDGGEFDQFTGATITPRAVVGAVFRGLKLYDKHRLELFPSQGDEAKPATKPATAAH